MISNVACHRVKCKRTISHSITAIRLSPLAGASGIVGSGITRQLLMEGAKVVALLRKVEQKEGLLKDCQGERPYAPSSACCLHPYASHLFSFIQPYPHALMKCHKLCLCLRRGAHREPVSSGGGRR